MTEIFAQPNEAKQSRTPRRSDAATSSQPKAKSASLPFDCIPQAEVSSAAAVLSPNPNPSTKPPKHPTDPAPPKTATTMTEPDDLYTLRAQFWLGHYQMAIDEAKSIARRPMPPNLKAEREEFLSRAYIASGQHDKALNLQDTPALQALSLKAQFEMAVGDEGKQSDLVDQLKTLAAANPTPSIQLTTSQVLLAAGQTKEALQQVHLDTTMEHIMQVLQIYLKLDRLDLAKNKANLLRQTDEDAVLTQMAQVYVSLATGSTGAPDALHALNSLTEQYGASPLLLNCMAAGFMCQGDFETGSQKLQECLRDFSDVAVIPDTLINLIVCTVQQNQSPTALVSQMKDQFPSHPFCSNFDRVEAAFEREAIKYKV